MKTVRLNDSQLDRLSEFLSNMALIFFASIITPFLTGGVLNLFITTMGFLIAAGFFITSLIILK